MCWLTPSPELHDYPEGGKEVISIHRDRRRWPVGQSEALFATHIEFVSPSKSGNKFANMVSVIPNFEVETSPNVGFLQTTSATFNSGNYAFVLYPLRCIKWRTCGSASQPKSTVLLAIVSAGSLRLLMDAEYSRNASSSGSLQRGKACVNCRCVQSITFWQCAD